MAFSPGASARPYQLLVVTIGNLASEMSNIDVDDVGRSIKALVPHMVDDHCSREDAIGVRHKVFEQGVLLCRKLDSTTRALYLLRKAIKIKIGNP